MSKYITVINPDNQDIVYTIQSSNYPQCCEPLTATVIISGTYSLSPTTQYTTNPCQSSYFSSSISGLITTNPVSVDNNPGNIEYGYSYTFTVNQLALPGIELIVSGSILNDIWNNLEPNITCDIVVTINTQIIYNGTNPLLQVPCTINHSDEIIITLNALGGCNNIQPQLDTNTFNITDSSVEFEGSIDNTVDCLVGVDLITITQPGIPTLSSFTLNVGTLGNQIPQCCLQSELTLTIDNITNDCSDLPGCPQCELRCVESNDLPNSLILSDIIGINNSVGSILTSTVSTSNLLVYQGIITESYNTYDISISTYNDLFTSLIDSTCCYLFFVTISYTNLPTSCSDFTNTFYIKVCNGTPCNILNITIAPGTDIDNNPIQSLLNN